MASNIERLSDKAIIGLDTSVFIYHFEGHPKYGGITLQLLTEIERGRWQGLTSVITLIEINFRPLLLGRQDAARQLPNTSCGRVAGCFLH